MQIAARLRQVRLQHSLSLEELATRTGLSASMLASFENGQGVPSRETIDKLAKTLGVPVQLLFYGDADPPSTRYLTPCPTLQELAGGAPGADRIAAASLLHFGLLRAAAALLRARIIGRLRR